MGELSAELLDFYHTAPQSSSPKICGIFIQVEQNLTPFPI